MTAVDVDALDKLREALAHHSWCNVGRYINGECSCIGARQQDADALLPVVDRIAAERAAAELEAAADEVKSWHRVYGYASGQLRARAAALRASNGEGA